MSGGRFNYRQQYDMQDYADEIRRIVKEEDFSLTTKKRLLEIADALDHTTKMLPRIDWVSVWRRRAGFL